MPSDYEKIISDAFHGTSLTIGNEIIMRGFIIKRGNDCFLGEGVYFYEGSAEYAKMWARGRSSGSKICVIEATVNLGKCLDLNTYEGVQIIKDVVNELKRSGKQITSGVAIALLCKQTSIETIRAADVKKSSGRIFEEDERGGFYEKAPLIICVKSIDNILAYDINYEGF